jgi:signal transduction histidine kinase
VDVIGETARQALTELRRLLGVLRRPPARLETAPAASLGELGDVLDQVRGTGLPVDFQVVGTPVPLAPGVDLTAYRIVQEALTNTLRHAVARHATVTIAYDQPQLRVRIADDGTAKAPDARRGHGIEGMRERAALHGGTLRAGPDPDAPAGWLVEATLAEATLGRP